MKKPEFNIFSVLEKDDKELIHSAFLKFLMQKDSVFCKEFLGLDECFGEATLEKQYTYLKKQRGRFDIEAQSADGKSLLVIENKFKAFPYAEQFKLYDKILNKHHKDKKVHKFLFCFDKQGVGTFSDWVVKDYSDLLLFIKTNYKFIATDDASVFIRHYYFLLEQYFEEYQASKADLRPLFSKSLGSKEKFLLKLFYSALKMKLETYFESVGKDVELYLNAGNTQMPLMNIVPMHWNIDGRELLIQFQGNDIKFYSHSADRPFLNEIIETARKNLPYEHFEYKKFGNGQSKTYFIAKTRVTYETPSGPITLEALYETILNFFSELEERVLIHYIR